jgi:hypothetical protein
MAFPGRRIPSALTLLAGMAIGWGSSRLPTPVVRANAGDRSGESILATGPVFVRYNEGTKVQTPQDALYYLDYKGGRLLGTIPSYHNSLGAVKLFDEFVERDLVADFKIDVDNGARPRFLMSTGSLGVYSDGWAPLYVFESTTSQVAVYKIQQQTIGVASRPKFELVEIRSFAGPQQQAAAER